MIFFSKRKKLEAKYVKWAEQNNIDICAETLIAYLVVNNLLNEEKVLGFLDENKKDCANCMYYRNSECFFNGDCKGKDMYKELKRRLI